MLITFEKSSSLILPEEPSFKIITDNYYYQERPYHRKHQHSENRPQYHHCHQQPYEHQRQSAHSQLEPQITYDSRPQSRMPPRYRHNTEVPMDTESNHPLNVNAAVITSPSYNRTNFIWYIWRLTRSYMLPYSTILYYTCLHTIMYLKLLNTCTIIKYIPYFKISDISTSHISHTDDRIDVIYWSIILTQHLISLLLQLVRWVRREKAQTCLLH